MSFVRVENPRLVVEHYAFAPAVDDAGQHVMAGAEWKGEAPSIAAVRNILATPRGGFAPKLSLGLDVAALEVLSIGAREKAVAVITEALDPLVRDGVIVDIVVEADVPRRGVVMANVTFLDPRMRRRIGLRWRS